MNNHPKLTQAQYDHITRPAKMTQQDEAAHAGMTQKQLVFRVSAQAAFIADLMRRVAALEAAEFARKLPSNKTKLTEID